MHSQIQNGLSAHINNYLKRVLPLKVRHTEAWSLYTFIVYLLYTTFENKVSRLVINTFIARALQMDTVLRKQSQEKHFLQNQTGLRYSSILPAQGKLNLVLNEERKEQV